MNTALSIVSRGFAELLPLDEPLSHPRNPSGIVGNSPALQRVLEDAGLVARTDSTILIQGETGTGKEVVARAIHQTSHRAAAPLIKFNCAAIPAGLLESELFGHEKGAFTGATAPRAGRFELAHRGTLFLDEIGDLPLELQPKLLRVLQDQEFERLGGTRTISSNVRLIAATNCDLTTMVEARRFRADLYYRLNVFPIELPALRHRRQDIPLLVRHFAAGCAQRMNKRFDTIPAEAMQALTDYHWPGNIRELQNVIERAAIVSPGPVLHPPIAGLTPARRAVTNSLREVERLHIMDALRQSNGVVGGSNGAAARLGLPRSTLMSKIQKLKVTYPPLDAA